MNPTETKYGLEYNREQGIFYYTLDTDPKPKNNTGWVVIAKPNSGSMHKIETFTDFIKDKYPDIFDQDDPHNNLSEETVREEYEIFDEWYEYLIKTKRLIL